MNLQQDIEDTVKLASKVGSRLKQVTDERDRAIDAALDITVRLFLMQQYWRNFAASFFWSSIAISFTHGSYPEWAPFFWVGCVWFGALGFVGTCKRARFEGAKGAMTTAQKLEIANRIVK